MRIKIELADGQGQSDQICVFPLYKLGALCTRKGRQSGGSVARLRHYCHFYLNYNCVDPATLAKDSSGSSMAAEHLKGGGSRAEHRMLIRCFLQGGLACDLAGLPG